LLAKCEYREAVRDELLRDRFVAGCASDKIRERLMLESDDMTCDEALVIAGNVERASKESRQVSHSHAHVDDASVATVLGRSKPSSFPGSSFPGGRDRCCYNCGGAGHLSSDKNCPARGRKCKGCGKVGHFVAYCKKSKAQQTDEDRSASRARAHMNGPTPVDYVDMSVEAVTGRLTGEATYVQCRVAGKPITLLLDTGARASILNKATVNKLQLVVHEQDIRLKAYGGSAIATLGAVEVPVVCGQRRVATFPFVVVELGSNIMGKNLFNQLGFKTDIPTTLLRTQESITAHVEEADVTPRQHSLQFKQQFDVLFR
jgi:hypothetical protein